MKSVVALGGGMRVGVSGLCGGGGAAGERGAIWGQNGRREVKSFCIVIIGARVLVVLGRVDTHRVK